MHDQLTDAWRKHASMPQPITTLTASVHCDDYKALGFPLTNDTQPTPIDCTADTGCQSCLGGEQILPQLGIMSDLLPVKMSMRAANNKGINIIGATLACFTGYTSEGDALTTKQMVYISNQIEDKLYLRREVCIALSV